MAAAASSQVLGSLTSTLPNNPLPPRPNVSTGSSDSAPPVEIPPSSTNGKTSRPQTTSQGTDQSNPLQSGLLSSISLSEAAVPTAPVPPNNAPFWISAGQNATQQHMDVAMFWKSQLLSVLPQRAQCDLLVSYYTDHMDWVYHGLHIPSFYAAYAKFWESEIGDVDIIWLSLLYTILSCGALYVPFSDAEAVGLDRSNLRHLANVWHSASRQALHAGGFEAKPCLTQLQTFLVTQLYWLATRNVETLNSCVVFVLSSSPHL